MARLYKARVALSRVWHTALHDLTAVTVIASGMYTMLKLQG